MGPRFYLLANANRLHGCLVMKEGALEGNRLWIFLEGLNVITKEFEGNLHRNSEIHHGHFHRGTQPTWRESEFYPHPFRDRDLDKLGNPSAQIKEAPARLNALHGQVCKYRYEYPQSWSYPNLAQSLLFRLNPRHLRLLLSALSCFCFLGCSASSAP